MAAAKEQRKPDRKADRLMPDEEHHEPLQIQILEKMSQLMTAAFGLVAALAWNNAIQLLIKTYFGEAHQLRVLLGYAVVITVIAVAMSLWIASVTHKVKAALGHDHPPTTA